jgi:hypothetical protein
MMRLVMLAVWLALVFGCNGWLRASTAWPVAGRRLAAGVLGTLGLFVFAFVAGYLGLLE